VDFIAVSFCRNAEDMNEARRVAKAHGSSAALVSKIERTEAIENLAEIVDASDVVMVARGDLGVEIGDAELPGLQKKIIREALARDKVVITATQMLQSMVDSPIPTRAEVLDVANAVIDGTDAVMLSQESAAGSWPVKAVEAMARICLGAEKQFVADTDFEARRSAAWSAPTRPSRWPPCSCPNTSACARGGDDRIRRHRALPLALPLAVPIFAFSRHGPARRKMALMRDVFPMDYDSRGQTPREAARGSIRLLVDAGLLQPGDRVVFTSGEHMETHGATNTLRLLEVGERRQVPAAWASSEEPQERGAGPGRRAGAVAAGPGRRVGPGGVRGL
jgi:pyruvate kinase